MLKLVRPQAALPHALPRDLALPRVLAPIVRESDGSDPFAALHDLVWVHTATTAMPGLEARLYELWAGDGDYDDDGVRFLLALAFEGQRASVWDLGVAAESALGITVRGAGHLVIAIDRPNRELDVRYTCEGGKLGATLRVGSRLIARCSPERAEPFASIVRAHDTDLESEEFLHARVFERAREPTLLLQLSGPCGETRSFDLGIELDVISMEADDTNTLHIVGERTDETGSRTRIALEARWLDGAVELLRVAETKSKAKLTQAK